MPERECGSVINVVIAGLGGQGIVKASDILASVAFLALLDVKKSDVHGMSQRGGSVSSDVRFGDHVYSPMVPKGEADYLVVLAPSQIEIARPALRERGILVQPDSIRQETLPSPKTLNVALLGVLSLFLNFDEQHWTAAIRASLPEAVVGQNIEAFEIGRSARHMNS